MSVYYLSAGGLNVTTINPINLPLQWVKLFPADDDPHHWTVQTFPADLSNVNDGSINDQSGSYVYFAQGAQPAPTPALTNNVASLTYDLAIPVGSTVELDPSVDWWVAYPVHGYIINQNLRANQTVTIVATRNVESIYLGGEGSPNTPITAALLAQASGTNVIPTGTMTIPTWQASGDSSAGLYAAGSITMGSPSLSAFIGEPGVYHIDCLVNFAPNSTGNRYVGIAFSTNNTFNANTDVKHSWTGAAGANLGGGQMPLVSWEGYIAARTNVYVIVYQDSGASLSLILDRTTLNIHQVA